MVLYIDEVLFSFLYYHSTLLNFYIFCDELGLGFFNNNPYHFSLEQDSPEVAAKLASTTIGSLDGPENQLVEDEGIQVVAPVEGHEPEKLEESPNAIAAMTLESPHNSSFSDDHINKSDAMSQPVDPGVRLFVSFVLDAEDG